MYITGNEYTLKKRTVLNGENFIQQANFTKIFSKSYL